jgi:hypothetical protein
MWQWLRDLLPQKNIGGLISTSHDVGTPLLLLSAQDNPAALSVVPIRNGFLVCSRVYNPNGFDSVEATFASGIGELSDTLVAQMTAARLKL